MEDTPIFSNTCGKIYDDNVVFAFDHGEKVIAVKKITDIKFSGRFTRLALLYISLPLLIYGVLDFMKNFNGIFRLGGYLAMAALTALAFYYAEKTYHISMAMTDGSKFSIRVSKNNRKDAKKFVEKLKTNTGL